MASAPQRMCATVVRACSRHPGQRCAWAARAGRAPAHARSFAIAASNVAVRARNTALRCAASSVPAAGATLCPRATITDNVYLGTMTFGWSGASTRVDETAATDMIRAFLAMGGCRVDTARIYASGETEAIVGAALRTLRAECREDTDRVLLGTKANPSGQGGLSPAGIRGQLSVSAAKLRMAPRPDPPGSGSSSRSTPNDSTDADTDATPWPLQEFYLHRPDPSCDLEASLEACDVLVREGLVREVGLSNYHAVEVARAVDLCEARGWARPTVYQGLYNPLNRRVEDELLPLLRDTGMRFVAFNPLAAGLLTGKHGRQAPRPGAQASATGGSSAMEPAAGGGGGGSGDGLLPAAPGRFKDNGNYQARFFTEPNFLGVARIADACADAGVGMIEATYRWLLLGSALDVTRGDGFIVGASSLDQLTQNLQACARVEADAARGAGALPPQVQDAFDAAWAPVAESGLEFPYWRSYHRDQPNRDALPAGALWDGSRKIA